MTLKTDTLRLAPGGSVGAMSTECSEPFGRTPDMNWNEITDKLLRRECSAVETYQQALRVARQELGRNAEFQELATILSDHQQAASQLEARLQQPERRAEGCFGGWDTWSKVVMGAANIFGDRVVLRALKAGEESGAKRYQEVLEASAVPAELKPLFLDLLAKQQAHIRTLDGLMSKRLGLPV